MNRLITKAYEFMIDCNLTYAFCGGYALELFANTSYRSHSDLDITLFEDSKKEIVDYIINKGWNVYEHMHSKECLRKIANGDDDVQNCFNIWAIERECSFIELQSIPHMQNCYSFEITDTEQKEFDFIEIIFNSQKDGNFICSAEHNIIREISKAILYNGQIPYLAPEVILFLISDPAYIASDYHRAKTNLDYETMLSLLSKNRVNWLITSIEKKYPQGNKRLEQLKNLKNAF